MHLENLISAMDLLGPRFAQIYGLGEAAHDYHRCHARLLAVTKPPRRQRFAAGCIPVTSAVSMKKVF
jgi:hypothetical protein